MNQLSAPRLSKLPFIIGDILLVATAAYVAIAGSFLGQWQYVAIISAVAFGAWLMVWPFILEFRTAAKLIDSAALHEATDKIKDLNAVSTSIAHAVAEWQHLQQGATQTVVAAEQVAERMTAEARNFGEVMGRMNESEKAHLRLEVEKLRRSESDWLGVLVRLLDHVHALHQAGVRSGQRNVIEQLTSFQNACRDTARRMGLLAIVPEAGRPFDATLHQLFDQTTPPDGSIVGEIVAPGYTFQGQPIRLPIVAVQEGKPSTPKAEDAQLSFDQATA
jgi:molecular chaperone GrpE (heat shock protein)